MKFLALDFGSKRIGLALCDENERLAFPHRTFERKPNDNRGDMSAILAVVKANEVGGIVCGVPGGSVQSEQTAGVAKRFFDKLRLEADAQNLKLEWHDWDERFSTSLFLNGLRAGGGSTKRARENGDVDAGAAAMMLEGFLEMRNREREA